MPSEVYKGNREVRGEGSERKTNKWNEKDWKDDLN